MSNNKVNKNTKTQRIKRKFEGDDDDMLEHEPIQVYSEGNKIYFSDEINTKSINSLCRLIEQKNQEYLALASSGYIKYSEPAPIILFIDSVGGSCTSGFRAIDMIKNSKVPIYTVVSGLAASSASQISVSGKKRFMTANGYMLLHQVRISGFEGKYVDVEDEYGNLSEIMEKTHAIYKNNCKLSNEQLDDMLKREKLLNLKQCIEYGLVDYEWKGDDSINIGDEEEAQIELDDTLKKTLNKFIKSNLEEEVESEHNEEIESKQKRTRKNKN
jgi:ATP-dependent Clp protease, protease subunit